MSRMKVTWAVTAITAVTLLAGILLGAYYLVQDRLPLASLYAVINLVNIYNLAACIKIIERENQWERKRASTRIEPPASKTQ